MAAAAAAAADPPWPLGALSDGALSACLGRPVSRYEVEAGSHAALDQCDCAVLRVHSGGGHPPARVFVKSMQARRLQKRLGKTGEDWAVNVCSWRNEVAFYAGLRDLSSSGWWATASVGVPRCLGAAEQAAEQGDPLDSTFTLLLDVVDERAYEQPRELTLADAAAMLRALARFHGRLWHSSAAFASLRGRLHARGCWWRKHHRPRLDCSDLVGVLGHLCRTFPAEFYGMGTREDVELFAWLQTNVAAVCTHLDGAPARTLVHGDAKAANAFFSRGRARRCPLSPGAAAAAEELGEGEASDVVLIDFQWAGAAPSGCGDVVYLLAGSAAPSAVADATAEAALLEAYHDELSATLARTRKDARDAYPRADFAADLALEWLDYASTALPYLLADLTPAALAANQARHGWLTHERDAVAAAWLVRRTLAHAAAVRANPPWEAHRVPAVSA